MCELIGILIHSDDTMPLIPIQTMPLIPIQTMPLVIWKDVKRASKWSDKLKCTFYLPGWSHDGPDLRAATLRSELFEGGEGRRV